MRERMIQELALLRHHYGDDVVYIEAGDWFLIPRYPLPRNCHPATVPICFSLRPGYPGAEPYGFFVAAGVTCNGTPIAAARPPAPPPFAGTWLFISWAPEGWFATADTVSGANLWGWARSFAARLNEAA